MSDKKMTQRRAARDDISNVLRELLPSRLKKVYHYTDAPGAFGILNTRELWMTDSRCLNDPRELTYGWELVMSQFRSADTPTPISISESGVRAFVLCFCEDGDSLSQWRAYGRRGGYALGFSPRALGNLRQRGTQAFGTSFVVKVSYDRVVHERIAKRIARRALKAISELPDASRERVAPIAAQMGAFALVGAMGMKDPSFAGEREWRLVSFSIADHAAVSYRPARTLMLPYLALPLGDDDAIFRGLECVVGPTPYAAIGRDTIAEMVRQAENRPGKTRDTRFRISEIPYRDW